MRSSSRYGLRLNGSPHGDVFTSPKVVQYMLDLVGYVPERDLSGITILEPSCGEGAFLVEIARRIKVSSAMHCFDAVEAFNRCVYAFDIDREKTEQCKVRLYADGIKCDLSNITTGDFLSARTPLVDIVIGNPPYVRYENIPEADRMYYKRNFSTYHYRADLYVPFYEKSLRALKAGGRHCFVCSNRWMKNEYGKKLRMFISHNYRVETIVNLEGADVFQEAVLAYPAITVIENSSPTESVQYAEIRDVGDLRQSGFSRRPMVSGADWSGMFNSVRGAEDLYLIEELGFKIGIGVATGADSVFISDRLPDEVEKELLLPAINTRNLRGDRLQWNGEYLLNPYDKEGRLIDLARYPKAAEYLSRYRDRLSARHVARKDHMKWYRTIDRINPDLTNATKILIPDISGNRYIFVDEGRYYPLHNLYYITGNTVRKQEVLSAVLMSDRVRQQVACITNNMNGGFPRWQSHYLRKLRVPDVSSLDEGVEVRLVDSYHRRDYDSINNIVDSLYAQTGVRKRKTRQYNMVFDYC